MRNKIKAAAVRAMHTFFQTLGGVLTTESIMTGVSWQTVGRAGAAGLIAAGVSFAKSLVAGMPEVNNNDGN